MRLRFIQVGWIIIFNLWMRLRCIQEGQIIISNLWMRLRIIQVGWIIISNLWMSLRLFGAGQININVLNRNVLAKSSNWNFINLNLSNIDTNLYVTIYYLFQTIDYFRIMNIKSLVLVNIHIIIHVNLPHTIT